MTSHSSKVCTSLVLNKINKLLITIDGPAGAGKTTVSKIIADRLNYRYIDTGALYRAVAFNAKQKGIRADDGAGLESLCNSLELDFRSSQNGLRLFSNDSDISDFIRTPEISMLASAVSAQSSVRKYLFDIQRKFGKKKGVVFEGRDMGTVVFPEADVKFFLMASVKSRAMRRFRQTQGQSNQTLVQVEHDMRKRDADDASRSLAPLMPANDAILIDSTKLSLEQVIENMLIHIQEVSAKTVS